MNTLLKGVSLSEKKLLVFALVMLIAYYLPYFILGKNSNILVHDNLDSHLAWIKMLLDNNALFASPSKIIPTTLNGLSVYQIYPYYGIPLLTIKVFGIYWGYVISKVIVSIIGFSGMYLLLRNHFLPKPYSPFILIGTSLIFGLLPFWSFSATVSGLPFILFAFLNIRTNKKTYYNWVIIILFAFHSSLVLTGMFLMIVLSLIWFYDTLKKRKINWHFIVGLAVLTGAYFISHFPMIYGFFDGPVPHRVEFFKPSISFSNSYELSKDLFEEGQYHAHSLHNYMLIPMVVLLVWGFRHLSIRIKLIALFIILTSLFYGFQNYHYIKPIVNSITQIIPLQLQRFHFLHPMFWYVLLAVSLSILILKIKYGQLIAQLLLIFQLVYVVKHHEIVSNQDNPTFKEFYSEDAFTRVKQVINKPLDSYKVISVGIHPAISQYNGFSTLDGYFPSYPLEYKHQFRKVIEDEILRSDKLKSYFDNWGSRCYAFSHELGLDFISNDREPIDSLNYNYAALKDLGGRYVFSATQINESINQNLQLLDSIPDSDSYYKIYIYEIRLMKK